MKIHRAEIDQLIGDCNLSSCFECGKCTASCPLSEFFGGMEFGRTPRGIIEKALLDSDLVTGDAIWYCLTCDVCTKGCPSGVRFRDFIEALRALVIEKGNDSYGARCRRCEGYFLPTFTQKLLLEKLCRDSEATEFLFFCPSCRRRRAFSGFAKEKAAG